MSFKKIGERRLGRNIGSGGKKQTPFDRILSTQNANLVQYLPFGELNLATAYDRSRQFNNGLYVTSPTLGVPGIGDGRTAVNLFTFPQFINVYSAALDTDFDGQECTFVLWIKANSAGVWGDASTRTLFRFQVDGSNLITVQKIAATGVLKLIYVAGGTTETVDSVGQTRTDFFQIGVTVSLVADEVKFYLGGVQIGATQTGLGTWVGNLGVANACVGSPDTVPSSPLWLGDVARWGVWSGAGGGVLTPDEIKYIDDGEPL